MNRDEALPATTAASAPPPELPALVITLLKGVLYREADERLWGALLNLQARVRDYFSVLALDLEVDEAEGYAFLRSRPDSTEADDAGRSPRLVARRPLSFPVSLLLALLRRKLAEFDAGSGYEGSGSRLVLSRDDIAEILRVFMPEGSNEARLIDQIDAHINKVVDLGFLRRLKPAGGARPGPGSFEVRRILRAFVDAQWLGEFEARLEAYRAQLKGEGLSEETGDE